MDDSGGVSGGQPIGNLDRYVEQFAYRDGSVFQQGAERSSREQFRNDIGNPAILTDVVDRHDVGVIERAGGARFSFEAAERFG